MSGGSVPVAVSGGFCVRLIERMMMVVVITWCRSVLVGKEGAEAIFLCEKGEPGRGMRYNRLRDEI